MDGHDLPLEQPATNFQVRWFLDRREHRPNGRPLRLRVRYRFFRAVAINLELHALFNSLNVSHLSIRAGEWDTQSNAEPLPHQNRKVSNVSIHPDYVGEIYYNDLALLFLSEPVELAENVDVICLPEEDQFDDVNCLASGWGKDEFGKKS